MQYSIYMLKPTDANLSKRFMSLAWVEKHGGITPNDYGLVYRGEIVMRGSIAGVLDGLYALHTKDCWEAEVNRKLPRKMSVSDVVVLGDMGAWYCDPLGWRKLDADMWRKLGTREGDTDDA